MVLSVAFLVQLNILKCSSIDDLKEFRDGEVTILLEKEFELPYSLVSKTIKNLHRNEAFSLKQIF